MLIGFFEEEGRCGRRDRYFARHERHGEGRERGWGRGEFGRGGFGRGRERLLDGGDIKLIILKLLSEQPSYGYQLIKSMEQRLSGGYTPSAGMIYPTLTMLEEEGLIQGSEGEGRKTYSLTDEGQAFLEGQKEQVERLFNRLEEVSRQFERGRSPEIMKALHGLMGAVRARVSRETVTPEQVQKIVEAIETATKTIDGV